MTSFIYDCYYMTRMIKDKLYHRIFNYEKRSTTVERMNKSGDGIFTSLYKLSYPSTHIIDNIYLGNAYTASNYNELKEKNIGLIINITKEIPNYYEKDFEYYNICVEDINESSIIDHIEPVLQKISEYNKNSSDKNILVHCFMGSSRSATIVSSYILKNTDREFKETLKYLTEKRSVVNINSTFVRELNDWYKGTL